MTQGLERRFGVHRALSGVDLDLRVSHSLAVFGSNGAGKSTLLRILAGLLLPSRGRVSVLGSELPASPALRRRIGMLAHDALVYGDLTARENLSYYARLYRIRDHDRINEVLAAVELTPAADRTVRTYSRGMLQRLALARAILHEPELLLLDEPFTGLDPGGAARLVALLHTLRDKNMTLVFTTHDLERGLELADRAVLLHAGRIAWHSSGRLPDVGTMRSIYTATVVPNGS